MALNETSTENQIVTYNVRGLLRAIESAQAVRRKHAVYVFNEITSKIRGMLEEVETSEELDQVYQMFTEDLTNSYRHIGQGLEKRNAKNFWLSELCSMTQTRSKLYRKAMKSERSADYAAFKVQDRALNHKERQEKRKI